LRMSNEWVLNGKFSNKFYFIIIFINILYSSLRCPTSKKNVRVNGNNEIGEDDLLKKQLKDDVDF